MQPSLLNALFVQHGQKINKQDAVANTSAPTGAPLQQPSPLAAAGGAQAALGMIVPPVPSSTALAASASPQTNQGTNGGDVSAPAVPGVKVRDVVRALLPGVAIKPEDLQYLVNMVRLCPEVRSALTACFAHRT